MGFCIVSFMSFISVNIDFEMVDVDSWKIEIYALNDYSQQLFRLLRFVFLLFS